MRSHQTEQSYRQRVGRVVAHIAAQPPDEHSLEQLASLAHFSPFHFHRVYRSQTGETVAATVRRVRLALAARLLEQGELSITEVALRVGYDSPQSFTRAFGLFTGQAPRRFQQQLQQIQPYGSAEPDLGQPDPCPTIQIIQRPRQLAYALRHHGPVSTIPHTQRRLHLHACASTASAWLGAAFGDPDQGASFSYYAAVLLPEPRAVVLDPEIELLELPAGLYAKYCLVGPYTRIDSALMAIFSRWLPDSGYEPDDRPTLEHYLNSPRTAKPAALRTDLLIPIRATTTP
jgi:AraC family transcriptional regulator